MDEWSPREFGRLEQRVANLEERDKVHTKNARADTQEILERLAETPMVRIVDFLENRACATVHVPEFHEGGR